MPRARAVRSTLPRIAATLGVLALVFPTAASALLKPADQLAVAASVPAEIRAQVEGGATCDFARLAELPRGLVLTTVNPGPTILWQTRHSISAAGYHRNQPAMLAMIRAFTSGPASAEPIVRATGANYVVACSSERDIALFRQAHPGGLADVLAQGRPPAWLAPVPGFDSGSLRVYRLREASREAASAFTVS